MQPRFIVDAVAALNRDLEETKPWEVARTPHRASELSVLLGRHLQAARQIADALAPILPGLSRRLQQQLNARDGRLPTAQPVFARLDVSGTMNLDGRRDDVTDILKTTGRSPLDQAEASALGKLADRLPVFS